MNADSEELKPLQDAYGPVEKKEGVVISVPFVVIETSTLREWWRKIKEILT